MVDGVGFIGGQEGLAEVIATGDQVKSIKLGEWILLLNQGLGTWQTHIVTEDSAQFTKIPRLDGLSPIMAATMSVNPPTAYRMLKDFVELKEGDVVVQNSANSGVGQAVIQICRAWGVKTVNIIRNRPNLEHLKQQLTDMGADLVITEEETRLPETAKRIAALASTAGGPKLGLNGVGGKSATNMARLLGEHSYLVTYGGMSKDPVTIPTSLYIFKNLKSAGFWMNKWYQTHGGSERDEMWAELMSLVLQGHLKEPIHETFSLGERSDKELISAVTTSLGGFLKGKPIFVP